MAPNLLHVVGYAMVSIRTRYQGGRTYVFPIPRSCLLEVLEILFVRIVGSAKRQRIVVFVHRLVLLRLLEVTIDGVEEPIQVSTRLSAYPLAGIQTSTLTRPPWSASESDPY